MRTLQLDISSGSDRAPLHRPGALRLLRITPRARWLMAMLLGVLGGSAAEMPKGPDEIFGALFADVQRARVFPDQKTFADAVPKAPATQILRAYAAAQAESPVDLSAFVADHFLVPEPHSVQVPSSTTLEKHLSSLWPLLRRSADEPVPGSSLLPLPSPYIVPGGRFREIYYWDSYFTMLGLRVSGQEALIESMVENFAYLLRTYRRIPNGNRTYYLSRSQPPCFALMVRLLAETKGPGTLARYLPALRTEHDLWMDRVTARRTQHRVRLANGRELARYHDEQNTPRPEAFADDEAVAARVRAVKPEIHREIRSACESGWDFSSRWFGDGRSLDTIQTLELVPVDLNCLLYVLERTLAEACRDAGAPDEARQFEAYASRRKQAVLESCWSPRAQFFCDYDLTAGRPSERVTLAGLFPLFCEIATPEQAAAVKQVVEKQFLKPGGVVTTLANTGQQWDAPNGWAPLQWITIRGLENYGYHELAAEIARRWIALNSAVYGRTGKLMEKYNVEDTSLEAGGGEYPGQDGFGWTNGVLLKLLKDYPQPPP